MKAASKLAMLVVVFMLLGTFVPMASAERDSLKVIITAEDKIYKTDDTIEVEVRVYDKGVLTDADEIEVALDTRWQYEDMNVFLSKISTGVYQGSYQIQEEDHHAYFYAYASKGEDMDEDELEIYIYSDRLELDINFAHQHRAYAWPDDSVTATLYALYRGELVDVDDFSYIRLFTPEDEEIELASTWISEGIYEVSYTFSNITESGNYQLHARASYAGAHAEAYAYITVNVFSVWYKLDSIAGSTATFMLGVADEEGKGVPNAAITITYPQEKTGTTGEDGTAIFSLTGVWNGVHVYGHVSAYGKYQEFEGSIYTEDPFETPNPSHHRFDVIYEGTDFIYDAGESITRSYKAYNCSVPMQNKNICYYITLEGLDANFIDGQLEPSEGSHLDGSVEVIAAGTVTTDELGDFSLDFKAPSDQGQVYINFEAGIPRHSSNYEPHSQWESSYDQDDGLVYEEDTDYIYSLKGNLWDSDNIGIESDPLVIGGKTKLTIKTSSTLTNGDQLFAKWMPGKPQTGLYIDDYEGEWVCWVDGGNIIFLQKNGKNNEYEGDVVIPEFMSKDGDYTIVAGNIDSDSGYPYLDHVTLKEGESASEEDTGILPIIMLFIVILIVVVIAIASMMGGKGKREDELPSEEETEPPQDAPFPPPDTTADKELPPPPDQIPPPPPPN